MSTTLTDNSNTVFSVSLDHQWRTDFVDVTDSSSDQATGLSRFVGDEANSLLRYLSTDDFQKLVDFEKQLREIENSTVFCSTVDDYMFTLNGEEMLKAKDASCSWNGFYKLKRELVNLESKS